MWWLEDQPFLFEMVPILGDTCDKLLFGGISLYSHDPEISGVWPDPHITQTYQPLSDPNN